jgi:hypothetical protein
VVDAPFSGLRAAIEIAGASARPYGFTSNAPKSLIEVTDY